MASLSMLHLITNPIEPQTMNDVDNVKSTILAVLGPDSIYFTQTSNGKRIRNNSYINELEYS